MGVKVRIEGEFAGRGRGWTDFSADVRESAGVEGSRGIHGQTPKDRVATPGALQYSLKNHAGNSAGLQGYYTPGHSNQRSGFRKGIGIRALLRVGDEAYADRVLHDDPVGYWRVDEASGSLADSTGNGYTGTATGTITYGETGLVGDGSDAISVENTTGPVINSHYVALPSLVTMDAFTLEAWISPAAAVAAARIFMSRGLPFLSDFYFAWQDSGSTQRIVAIPPASRPGIGETAHYVATHDGTVARVYVNGALVAEEDTYDLLEVAATGWRLGAHTNTSGASFDGTLDEMAIYDYPLEADTVAAHYALRTATAELGSTTYIDLWTGTLAKIDPEPGSFGPQLTHCTCFDYMNVLTRQRLTSLETEEDITEEDVFDAIIDAVSTQPRAREVTAGFDTFPFAFDVSRDESTAPITEMQRLAQSSLSLIYLRGDGTIVYEPRTIRATPGEPIVELDEFDVLSQVAPDIDDNEDDLVNLVQTIIAPRRQEGSSGGGEVVLARINAAQPFEPGGPFAVRILFTDPAQRAIRAGGIDMVNAVSTTDYLFNSQADGAGTNLTASVVVDTAFTSNAVIFSVTNNSGQTAYATKLQARGVGVLAQEGITLEASDADSIAAIGENAFSLEMPYQADVPTARESSEYLLHILSQERRRLGKVSILLTGRSDEDILLYARRDISDRMSFSEPVTALSGYEFHINAVDFSVESNGVIWLHWTPVRADATDFWFLGVQGFSELGQTTRLGFAYMVGHTDVDHEDAHEDTAHGDTAHSDSHTDDAHEDAGHGDSGHADAHNDTAHSDSHTDAAHQDTAHSDGAHDDSHSDAAHGDVSHADSSHADSHTDGAHGDAHQDDAHVDSPSHVDGEDVEQHADEEHDDIHTDESHGDSHSDNAHGDAHTDNEHEDQHDDDAHSDVSHADSHGDSHTDTSHADSHSDSAHTDAGHQDTAHGDSHTDTSHDDAEHEDAHEDQAHGDSDA